MREKFDSWEPYLRSILRIILAFTLSLHGYRLMFGFFNVTSGRNRRFGMALDTLPHLAGLVIIVGTVLLFLGLFTRITALVLSILPGVAYLTSAVPRSPWTFRNGGEETTAYFFLFLYFAATGGGAWSLDYALEKRRYRRDVGAALSAAGAPVRS